MKDFPYKTSFSCQLNKISNDDLDKYISKAGLDKLKPLMPKNVNLEKNKDLIGIVLNCAVGGRVNANGDSITGKTAVKIAKNFINKYVNIGHKRDVIKGVIVNYGFSKFENSDLIAEEEAEKSEEPFNISLAILLWKTALNEKFIELLEASVDPTSDKYNAISASWELLFTEYDIAVGTKNINESEIIQDEEKKKELEKYLLANGGSGKKDNKLVYRVIKGEKEDDFLIPAGIGLVSNPAADVKGLEIVNNKEDIEKIQIEASNYNEILGTVLEWAQENNLSFKEMSSILSECKDIDSIDKLLLEMNEKLNNLRKEQKNISQKQNLTVIANDKQKDNIKIMKITKIEDINSESLKTCEASAIIEFINEEVKKANDKFLTEQKNSEQAKIDLESTKKELDTVKANLEQLQNKVTAKEEEELYNQRMAYFDDTYELAQEERQAIANEIKGVDKDLFEKIKGKYDIFLKNKSKAAIQAKKDEEQKKAQEAKAAELAKADDNTTSKDQVIDDALKNGKDANANLPNAQSPETKWEDQFAEAFKIENCVEIRKK